MVQKPPPPRYKIQIRCIIPDITDTACVEWRDFRAKGKPPEIFDDEAEAHFALNHLVLDLIVEGGTCRVVKV
jgi:hypothetical protein